MSPYKKFLVILVAFLSGCGALDQIPPNQILSTVCGVDPIFYSAHDENYDLISDHDYYYKVLLRNRNGFRVRVTVDVIDGNDTVIHNVLTEQGVADNSVTVRDDIYVDAGVWIWVNVEKRESFANYVPCNSKKYYLEK